MFFNEFSLFYLMKVRLEMIIVMVRIIGQLMSKICVLFGVNVLWDFVVLFDLVMVIDVKFICEIFIGVYVSDFGVWDMNVGEIICYQYCIGVGYVKMLFNIVLEVVVYLGNCDVCLIVKLIVFNNNFDVLCVLGLMVGVCMDSVILK